MSTWIRWSILAAAFIGALALSGPASADERPTLVGRTADGDEVGFTLAHTEIGGDIISGWARIVVTQTWENPFAEPLEGVYRFPLPHDAAVDRVAMIVGKRLIEGEIMERERAEQVYEQARDEGRHASLTEEERPNVFSQSVANVLPGETILVTLRFVMPLELEDGEYTLALPTTVGPRYAPAGHEASTARLNAPVLAEGEDTGHRLDVSLRIRPGVPLLGVHSPTHVIAVTHAAQDDATVTLDPDDRVPNKDLVLRYRVASKTPGAGLLATRSGRTGTFALGIEPPASDAGAPVRPRELVFVVDTSGSMMGEPLEKAKAVMRHAVANLGPDDTFQIINFSSQASSLSPKPLDRSPANVARALDHIDHLAGEGGTEMLSGIRAALDGTAPRGRLRIVLFLTDGYIGNDAEVISYVKANIRQARLFSLGVGSSVNRYLLDQLAEMGRGAVEYVTPYEEEEPVVDRFYARIGAPVLTDIQIEWGGLPVHDISPLPIPDLFIGQPLRVLGRYDGPAQGTVRVHGLSGGKEVTIDVPVNLPANATGMELIETVWARREIARLTGDASGGAADAEAQATKLALDHHLLSPWTSFVAVERDAIANPTPEQLRTALAAIYMPDGVEHAGIFGEPKPPALLTPDRIMPGDPDILVHAPRDARRVLALLPWGEPVMCTWVEGEDAWMGRFLVPREAAEGLYPVRVFVELSDGAKQTYSLVYRVDFTAPVMELELPEEAVEAGAVLSLRALPLEGVYEGKAVRKVGRVTVRMRADVKRVSVRIGDTQVYLAQTDRGEAWEGHLRLPETLSPGRHEIELVVTDYAGNSMRQTTAVVVR